MLIQEIRTGKRQTNISAVTLVIKALIAIFVDVVKSLDVIQKEVQNLSFDNVRSFIVSYSQFEPSESLIFCAIQAPIDDLFYISPDSPEWNKLKKVIVDVTLSEDKEKYRDELTQVLHMISGAGAAIFEGLNEESAFKQGWQITKILQFLQMQTHNSVVKKASKASLPYI
jgi:hypothetical protein